MAIDEHAAQPNKSAPIWVDIVRKLGKDRLFEGLFS